MTACAVAYWTTVTTEAEAGHFCILTINSNFPHENTLSYINLYM